MIVRRAEAGFVLIVVLILLMAVTATGHSLLVLARAELSVSQARWAALARRLAAEGGVRIASSAVENVDSLDDLEWLPGPEGRIPPRGRFATAGLRLASEIVLLRSEGRVDGLPGVHAVVGLYWGMDAEARVGAAKGVVESGRGVSVEPGSHIDASRITETPAPWPGARCERHRAAIDTLFLGGLPAWSELADPPFLESRPGRSGGDDLALPSLGLLGHEALLTGADVLVPRSVTPGPVRAGSSCRRTAPVNWGAPLSPSDPCAGYMPVVASAGPLEMRGGVGQGVLLVVGDAVLSAGARYFGVVLVAGDLTMKSDARIHGLVRVAGSVSIGGGSVVVGAACAALAALESAESLQGLMALPAASWIHDSY